MKGFTLIELMGVIVILAILSVITVVGVDKMLLNGKQELYEQQIDIIELSAKNWLTDNPSERPEDEPKIITINKLVESGYIESEIKNPKTGSNFDLETKIKITKNNNTYEFKVLN